MPEGGRLVTLETREWGLAYRDGCVQVADTQIKLCRAVCMHYLVPECLDDADKSGTSCQGHRLGRDRQGRRRLGFVRGGLVERHGRVTAGFLVDRVSGYTLYRTENSKYRSLEDADQVCFGSAGFQELTF